MKLNGILGTAGGAVLAVGLVAASPASAAPRAPRPSATVANDTLTVTGTSRDDDIAVRLAASGAVEVDLDGDGTGDQSFDRTTFSKLVVRTGSNDDHILVGAGLGTLTTTLESGSGDDVIDGGDASEVIETGSGNDLVDGNRGNDTASLGSSSDTFRWDPGDGSDVVEGDSGTDTLDFNGANVNENMSLSANGQRSLFLRDVANIRMDMDNVERLDLTTLGGTDTVTVDDMSGTDFRNADVDLAAASGAGDGQADTVTVVGTNDADDIRVETDGPGVRVEGLRTETAISGNETIDVLRVEARGGDDDVDVANGVAGLIQVVVDLGPQS
jgi:hypothetical protein